MATNGRDPNAPLRSAVVTFLDRACRAASEPKADVGAKRKGPRHPYVRLVNREGERLVKAFRAAMREAVTALPGRAQKGAVDAALRKVTPTIARRLRA
jgi:hypothetical protein